MKLRKDGIGVFIVNQPNSKIRGYFELQMLWTAAMFSELTLATGALLNYLNHWVEWDSFPEKRKYEIALLHLKSFPDDEEEGSSKFFMEAYETTQKLKKFKNKPKEFIVLITKVTRSLNAYYDMTRDWYKNTVVDNNYSELKDFISFNNAVIKPIMAFPMQSNSDVIYAEDSIRKFTFFIKDDSGLPMIDYQVKEIEKGTDISVSANADEDIKFLYSFLFEFPAPEKLNSSQLTIIRSEMSNVFWDFLNKLVPLNEKLRAICFEKNSFAEIAELVNNEINETKPQLQRAINDNTILNELKSNTPDGRTTRIFIGISSFKTLVNYYLRMNIVSEPIALYSMEEIEKNTSTVNSKLFLFIESFKAEDTSSI